MRSSLLHELPVLRDGSEEVVPGLDMTTSKGQPLVQAKGNEPSGLKATQLKERPQLEQARSVLQDAKSAGLPQCGDH